MRNVEIKKIISYVILALFLISLSYFLLRFYIHQNNIIFIPTFILSITLFIISIFSLEISLLIFVFFIPILNSLNIILRNIDFPVVYFLFIGFFLGCLINLVRRRKKSLLYFEERIYTPSIIFLLVVFISFVFTVLRLINFYPFFVRSIVNYLINVQGWDSFTAVRLSLTHFLNYLSGFLFFFIIYNLDLSKKFFHRLFYAISGGFFIVLIVGLYQIIVDPGFGNFAHWVRAGRLNSTLTDPNSLAIYLFILMPMFIGFSYYFKGIRRFISIIFFLLSIFLLMFTGSRTGFLGLVSLVVFYFIYLGFFGLRKALKRAINNKLAINLTSIVIVFILLFVIVIGSFNIIKSVEISENLPALVLRLKSNIDKIGAEGYLTAFSSGRDILWKQAILMFKDYPISGVGIGQYVVEVSNYHKYFDTGSMLVDYADNYYLQILSEMGIVPLMFIVWFFIEVVISFGIVYSKLGNRRVKFLYLNLFLVFAIMLVLFITGAHTIFLEIQFMFFLIIGLIVYFKKLYKSYQLDKTNEKQGSL